MATKRLMGQMLIVVSNWSTVQAEIVPALADCFIHATESLWSIDQLFKVPADRSGPIIFK